MIPEKLLICGHEVNVRIDRLDDIWGEARPGQAEIVLADNLSPDIQLQTLIHEILHFADAFYDIFDEKEGERRIQATSAFLHEILTRNQELIKAFLKKESDVGE